ncbi:class I SAM-dependent methyltransferase [Pseudenhygromyxa sp. WMMC2535]|uniref:class I SAM-dependent methyltransferase n=1 Tax=Pseudenhygromyxa sp. WMMC2535 TaxID=2712867 RepID=UPI001554E47A|nr:class I SAM-dependent methyltransferase [Pseudenhygromyxa sp. WMMC2535]NVB37560.1 class I SAM-dependent methyltransferase [Pseudenhygromyxa sp. WMMC2535]
MTTTTSTTTSSKPNLSGVPETMLWTLHNRASEAARADGMIRDPKCLEIYRALDFDYERSFGAAEPSHAIRSAMFDDAVREFIAANPDAVIVNLGEGLETERYRIRDDDGVLWLSVDLPEAIEIRERFIEADARHRHVAKSALDTTWFDAVPEGRPVLVTAQGLFMYFAASEVRGLLRAMAERWPGVEVMFDYIPPWLSRKTTSEKGWWKTPHYQIPPAPWGIKRSELLPTLRAWLGDFELVSFEVYKFPRGLRRVGYGVLAALPWIKDHAPGVVHMRLR